MIDETLELIENAEDRALYQQDHNHNDFHSRDYWLGVRDGLKQAIRITKGVIRRSKGGVNDN